MTKTYSTTDLAAVLGCTITNIRDRLERSNVAPIHTRTSASGRVSRLYGQDAYDLVSTWATAAKARKAASKARATAKAQRKLARELKKANAEAKIAASTKATASGQPTKLDLINSRLDALDAKISRALDLINTVVGRTLYPAPAPIFTRPNTGDAPYPWPQVTAESHLDLDLAAQGRNLLDAYDEAALAIR